MCIQELFHHQKILNDITVKLNTSINDAKFRNKNCTKTKVTTTQQTWLSPRSTYHSCDLCMWLAQYIHDMHGFTTLIESADSLFIERCSLLPHDMRLPWLYWGFKVCITFFFPWLNSIILVTGERSQAFECVLRNWISNSCKDWKSEWYFNQFGYI